MTQPDTKPNSAHQDSGNVPRCASKLKAAELIARLPNLKAHLIFWPLVVGGVILDLWSKTFVFDWLHQQGRDSFPIINGFVRLVMALNDGAAFGLFRGNTHWLAAVSVIALLMVFGLFLFGGFKQKLMHVALALFTAGVLGNLYDRIFNGGLVRDFIDVVYWPGRHWPAFNVADSMLCIAVALLITSMLLTEKSH
ncbi:MAG: signal peptidase II [Planctomycetota bacterium]|nr:MAG: signal peptidase II [Planctomycetota bacterium]